MAELRVAEMPRIFSVSTMSSMYRADLGESVAFTAILRAAVFAIKVFAKSVFIAN